MFHNTQVFLLIIASLFLGFKHGLDYDHIAAIFDITSSQTSVHRGLILSFFYSIGHGTIVAFIGLVGLWLGLSIPKEFLTIMEKVVGFTLIFLGGYVFYSLYKHANSDFRLLPRWALLLNGILTAYDILAAKLIGKERKTRKILESGYGGKTAFMIGGIHALGAETPTQMLVFVLATTAGIADKTFIGAVMIGIFTFGVILNNSLLGVLATFGYKKSLTREGVYKVVALFTAILSIILGAIFISGGISNLPSI
jgi:high-affinity nickel-transport protein